VRVPPPLAQGSGKERHAFLSFPDSSVDALGRVDVISRPSIRVLLRVSGFRLLEI
jgi:hypothetical protein